MLHRHRSFAEPLQGSRASQRFLVLLLALSLSSCASLFWTPVTPTPSEPTQTPAPPTATPPPSVATVNGESITLAEFKAELERYKSAQNALGKPFTDEDANKIVLEDLIAQILLSQGAKEAGFKLTEADLRSRINALAEKLGSAEALTKWEADRGYDDESFRTSLQRSIESAWMRDRIIADVSSTSEQVHIRQILTYNLEDAQAVLSQLNGGADFDEMAALYDPITRGELGWVPQGYLLDAKADEAVFALQADAYSDVITTDAGFHIFKVIERGNHTLTPDALLAMQEQALKDWLATQRAQSEIILAP